MTILEYVMIVRQQLTKVLTNTTEFKCELIVSEPLFN